MSTVLEVLQELQEQSVYLSLILSLEVELEVVEDVGIHEEEYQTFSLSLLHLEHKFLLLSNFLRLESQLLNVVVECSDDSIEGELETGQDLDELDEGQIDVGVLDVFLL